jgi:hypothetical protein
MTLRTLADVRELVERHLPAECRARNTWRHVAKCLDAAARGRDISGAVVALRLVLPAAVTGSNQSVPARLSSMVLRDRGADSVANRESQRDA